jgi:hypothetical protein
MTREELVDAYVEGRVSRRGFIRGLVALGVTAGAAGAYAGALASASPARAGTTAAVNDIYDIYNDSTTTTSEPSGAVNDADASRGAGAVAATPSFTG